MKDGTFQLQQMFAQFLFANWNPKWTVLVDGKPLQITVADIPVSSRLAMDVGSCRIGIEIRSAAFEGNASNPGGILPTLRWMQAAGKATLDLALYKVAVEVPFHCKHVREAGVAFTCIFDD